MSMDLHLRQPEASNAPVKRVVKKRGSNGAEEVEGRGNGQKGDRRWSDKDNSPAGRLH